MSTLWHRLRAWFRQFWARLTGTDEQPTKPETEAPSPPPEPVKVEPEPEPEPVPKPEPKPKPEPEPEPPLKQPRVQLAMLPAHNGDTLLLGFEDEAGQVRQIWIDGGLVKSYREHHRAYLERIREVGGKLDLVVVTHVDQDHIGGVLALCQDEALSIDELVDQFWFNAGDMIAQYFETQPSQSRGVFMPEDEIEGTRSLRQGMSLEALLSEHGGWHDRPIRVGQVHDLGGAKLTILSPDDHALQELNEDWEDEKEKQAKKAKTRSLVVPDYGQPVAALALEPEKEDRSVANGSSIAMLFEYGPCRLLLLGDAHPSVVAHSLQAIGYSEAHRLKVDAVKLSHHCSKASNTRELLNLLDCDTWLISTDGSRHGLPNKTALARLLTDPKRDPNRPIQLVYNHDNAVLRGLFTEEEVTAYRIEQVFPGEGEVGVRLEWGG